MSLRLLLSFFVSIIISLACHPAFAGSQKPVNFIFLIDTSGSMVARSTMVTDSSGSQTTLFEAMRKAVSDIIADSRLIKQGSRVSFITFGTVVSEKADWPAQITSDVERSKLVGLISDPVTLSADKKGDTYMGGALNQALARAIDIQQKTDPCTTTYILMLTDGWDEPPAGAPYKVQDVARKMVEQKVKTHQKLGIDTWQTAVLGLKRLPAQKAGTTTAAQVASLLQGTFLDITQEKGKSVSEQIYASLSKILDNQAGVFKLVNKEGCSFPMIDFGTVDGEGQAKGSFVLELLACDQESITTIKEGSRQTKPTYWKPVTEQAHTVRQVSSIRPVAELPQGAIKITADENAYTVSPNIDQEGHRSVVQHTIDLKLQAGPQFPVGTFVGKLKLASTARCPDSIPYMVSATSRLTTSEDTAQAKVKRRGFLINQETATAITATFVQGSGSPKGAVYNIEATISSAAIRSKKKDAALTLDASCFNDGKPVSITFDTNKQESSTATINVLFPANAKPGKYEGTIKLNITGPEQMTAPKELPFAVVLQPTDWERVAPVAVPMFLLLIVGIVAYIFLSFSNRR